MKVLSRVFGLDNFKYIELRLPIQTIRRNKTRSAQILASENRRNSNTTLDRRLHTKEPSRIPIRVKTLPKIYHKF